MSNKLTAIRPIAICIFSDRDRILVLQGHDHIKNETFYRPIGGGVKFTEQSSDTIIREIREEINNTAVALKLLGVMESIFEYEGKQSHEIVFVYDGRLEDRSVYEKEVIHATESKGTPLMVLWKQLADFDTTSPQPDVLYPDGLMDLLRDKEVTKGEEKNKIKK